MSLLAFQDVLTTVIGIILMLVMILVLELGMVRRVVGGGVPPKDQLVRLEADRIVLEQEWNQVASELAVVRKQIAERSDRSAVGMEARIIQARRESERVRRERQEVEKQIDALWKRVGGEAPPAFVARAEERSKLRTEVGRLEEAIEEVARSNRLTYRISGDGRDRNKRPIIVEAGADRYRVGGMGERERVRDYTAPTTSERLLLLRQQLALSSPSSRYVLLVAKPSLSPEELTALRELFEELGFETGFDIVPEQWTVLTRSPGVSP